MNIQDEQKAECLLTVASAALASASGMPSSRQAQLYAGLSIMLRETSPVEAAAAEKAMEMLHAAEAAQMTFADLLAS